MDLTHADYLHPDSLGGGINTRASCAVEEADGGIMIRWTAGGETLPAVMNAQLPEPGQPGDFLNEVHWFAPGVMRQRVMFGPAGRMAEAGLDSWTAHVMTPSTSSLTHYFFCHTSDSVSRDSSIAEGVKAVLLKAFKGEDSPMLELQQGVVGEDDFWDLRPVLLSIDAGAVRVRRTLDGMIQREAEERRA